VPIAGSAGAGTDASLVRIIPCSRVTLGQ